MFDRYKFKMDDTLSLIAKKYGTNEDYLKSINDIYFLDTLREGVDIVVPVNTELYYDAVKVKSGGTISEIANRYNVNPILFAALNGLNNDDYIYREQEILLPKQNYSFYVTAEGDTIDSVSNTFSITKERLLSQNPTLYLFPGQIIVNKKIN